MDRAAAERPARHAAGARSARVGAAARPSALAARDVPALQRAIGKQALQHLLSPRPGFPVQRAVAFTTRTVGAGGLLANEHDESLFVHLSDKRDRTPLELTLDPATHGAELVRKRTDERGPAITIVPSGAHEDYVVDVEATAAHKGPFTVRASQGASADATQPFRTVDEFGDNAAGANVLDRTTLAKLSPLRMRDDADDPDNDVGPEVLTTIVKPAATPEFEIMEAVSTVRTGSLDNPRVREHVQEEWEDWDAGVADRHITSAAMLNDHGLAQTEPGTTTTDQVHRFRSDEGEAEESSHGVVPSSGFKITRNLTVDTAAKTATLRTVKEGAAATVGDLQSGPGEGRVEHTVTYRE
jgi:hypothetical protein